MTVIGLAPFGINETPLDLTYTFRDAAGAPIDLTGSTVKATFTGPGTALEVAGYLADAANGVTGFAWTTAMTATAGPWSVVIWVDLAGQTLGSAVIVYTVTNYTAPTF